MTSGTRRFGVEQERFVFHSDSAPPSHAEIDALYERLNAQGFERGVSDAAGRCLAVVRRTEAGDLIVTNDCFTHVVEIAFPPSTSLTEFAALYQETTGLVDRCLAELGLAVRTGGAVDPPAEIHSRPKADDPGGARLSAILNRPALNHALFCPAIPACIAATQVSLGIAADDALTGLPRFYQFEPLVPVLFGNSPTFQGVRGACVRSWAMMENFPTTHPLLGVPARIPRSAAEYAQMLQAGNSRDYSFVAIRSPQRVEFRSACSQNTLDEILLLIRFRLAVEKATRQGEPMEQGKPAASDSPRELFLEACRNGPGPWCAALLEPLVRIDPELEPLVHRLGRPAGI